jgi:prophage regulatory protein
MERILRRRDLRAASGLGVTRIDELIREGRFPRPIRLGDRAVGWLESDVAAWQAKRIAERDSLSVVSERQAGKSKPLAAAALVDRR